MRICIVVFVSLKRFEGRPQRLAAMLANENDVYWIDYPESSEDQETIAVEPYGPRFRFIRAPRLSKNLILKTVQKEMFTLNAIRNLGDMDVYIFYDAWGTFLARHYVAIRGIPTAFEFVDRMYAFAKTSFQRLIHKVLIVEALRSSDLIICSSHSLYNEAARQNNNVRLVPNGATIVNVRGTKKLEKPSVGFVGAIGNWVNIQLIARTAKFAKKVNFYFLGEGTESDLLLKLSKKNRNVRVVGMVPYTEIPKWIKSFDVCIIPFKINDGTAAVCPLKLFEYWACKKPVLATPTEELVRIGKDRLIFFETAEQLADNIQLLLSDNKLRVKLGIAGFNLFKREYQWSNLKKRFLEALEVFA